MEEYQWTVMREARPTPWRLFIVAAIVSSGIALYFFFTQNYFAIALFVVAPIVLVVAVTHGPESVSYRISEEGVHVRNSTYPYKQLRYFSFIDDTLIIKPKRKNPVYLFVNPDDQEPIRSFLISYIPEKEHHEDFFNIVNRFLRIH